MPTPDYPSSASRPEGTPSGAGDRKFVTALARGLELLRCYTADDTWLGNRDFVERTGLPKATVSRLTFTLAQLGYLRYEPGLAKYVLDAGVLALGGALLAGSDLVDLARPHMRALARESGAAVSLGCREGLDMIYLETIRSETALTLGLAAGSRLSMLTSSMGRAYLAVQPAAARQVLYESLLNHAGAAGAGLLARARREVSAYATEGCCYSFREWHEDVNAAAVAFLEPVQRRCLVLSCSGPASSMDEHFFRTAIGPKLRVLAARLGVTPADGA
jgi:DNA-binding IclR family transcriptional regulator